MHNFMGGFVSKTWNKKQQNNNNKTLNDMKQNKGKTKHESKLNESKHE